MKPQCSKCKYWQSHKDRFNDDSRICSFDIRQFSLPSWAKEAVELAEQRNEDETKHADGAGCEAFAP